jgi:hypothetical protein
MVFFFLFSAIVHEIPSPKHREIQEFCQNCHISAIIFIYFYFLDMATLISRIILPAKCLYNSVYQFPFLKFSLKTVALVNFKQK